MTGIAADIPYVFISYASVNRSRVIEIADCLESSGIGIWFDRADIPGGTSYGPEIVSGIKNAAAVVLMCSKAALASRNVRQEIQLAWRHERPILPMLLEPLIFPDDVSYWLEGAQWIEVLDSGPDVWLDQVRYSLTLMGYAGLRREATEHDQDPGQLIELPPNNLPSLPGPIIGRDRELKQIKSLLANGRLLTLTGPGGTGKTRLAEEAARESAAMFSDGIWFVDAANARDPESLAAILGEVLQIREAPGESLLESIASAVQGKRLLLILDNLEQITGASSVLDALLQSDGVSILATSRAPTRSTQELVVPVSPLETVIPDQDTPASVIGRNPAVQLFVNRSSQVKPDFQLSDGNAFEIASICARLDGLPLAIELAAARSRLLHPAALLNRLDNRLNLLTRGGGRSARQQTLLSTISWSYDLLPPREQAVFRRLGVFAGGATIESAEAVVPAIRDDVSQNTVLDSIDTLIDHSLLEVDRSHHGEDSYRIRMLETLREFALTMLLEAGELERANSAHAAHFIDVAEELGPQLETGQQSVSLVRLTSDHPNLTTAIEHLAQTPNTKLHDDAVRLAAALWRFWWMRGNYSEGRRLIDLALASSASNSAMRARALNGAGVMAFSTGDLQGATAHHSAAAELSEELGLDSEHARSRDNLGIVSLTSGAIDDAIEQFESALLHYRNVEDQRGIAIALEHLAAATISKGDLEQARELAVESLAERRKLGSQQLIGYSLQQLGIIAMYSGEYEEARGYYSQAQVLAESLDDPSALANTLLNLASATEMVGEYDAARVLLNQSLHLYKRLDDAGGVGYTHYMLGHVARKSGKPDIADELLALGLKQLLEVGELDAVALCIETLAGVRIDLGDFETAASILGAAHKIRESTGAAIPGTRQAELGADITAVTSHLGAALYRERFQAGSQSEPLEFIRSAENTNSR